MIYVFLLTYTFFVQTCFEFGNYRQCKVHADDKFNTDDPSQELYLNPTDTVVILNEIKNSLTEDGGNTLDDNQVSLESNPNLEVSINPDVNRSSTDEDNLQGLDHQLKNQHNVIDKVGPPSLSELPSLEEVAADSIGTHEIPTFNEYHAMLSEGAQQKRTKQVVQEGEYMEQMETSRTAPPSSTSLYPHPATSSASSLDTNIDPGSHQNVLDTGQFTVDNDSSQVGDKMSKSIPNDNSNNNLHTSESSGQIEADVRVTHSRDSTRSEASKYPHSSLNSNHESDQNSATKAAHSTSLDTGTFRNDERTDGIGGSTLRRNLASVACGAKVLGSSKLSKNPEALLNENHDEYLNVPCSADKWLILEVCQPVQLQTIELANYELFSSRLKDFTVHVSDRYPTKNWDLIGTFVARDIKGLQSFDVKSDKMIKYVKFELLTHYGSEHYCPLTMIRLFGLGSDDLDEDEDVQHQLTMPTLNIRAKSPTNKNKLHHPADERTHSSPTNNNEQSQKSTPSVTKHKQQQSEEVVNEGVAEFTVNTSSTDSISNKLESPGTYPDIDHESQSSNQPVVDENESLQQQHHQNKPIDQLDDQTVIDQLAVPSQSDSSEALFGNDDRNEQDVAHDSQVNGDVDVSATTITNNVNDGDLTIEHINNHQVPKETITVNTQKTSEEIDKSPATSHHTVDMDNGHPNADHAINPMEDNTGKSPHPRLNNEAIQQEQLNLLVPIRTFFTQLSGMIKSKIFDTIGNLFKSKSSIDDIDHQDLLHFKPTDENFYLVHYLLSQNLSDPESINQELDANLTLGLINLKQCLLEFNPRNIKIGLELPNLLELASSPPDSPAPPLPLSSCVTAKNLLHLSIIDRDNTGRCLFHVIVAYAFYHQMYCNIDNSVCPKTDSGIKDFNRLVCNPYKLQTECLKLPAIVADIAHPSEMVDGCDESELDLLPEVSRYQNVNAQSRYIVSNDDVLSESPSQYLSSTPQPRDTSSPPSSTQSATSSFSDPAMLDQHAEQLVVPASLGGSYKSTALMRLNNRMRLIERNVSVSMRYLEELSQSYRRQMERLSRSFNLTYFWLKATAHHAEERDRQQQIRISELEARLTDLMARLKPRALYPVQTDSMTSNHYQITKDNTSEILPSSGEFMTSTDSSSMSSSSQTSGSDGTGNVAPNDESSSIPPIPDLDNSLFWNPLSSSLYSGHWLKPTDIAGEDLINDWDVLTEQSVLGATDNDDIDRGDTDGDDNHPSDTIFTNDKTKAALHRIKSSVLLMETVESRTPNQLDTTHRTNCLSKSKLESPTASATTTNQRMLVWIIDLNCFIHDWLPANLDPQKYICAMCFKLQQLYRNHSKIYNLIGLAILHLTLAVGSQLLIYTIWLRPKSRNWQLSCPALIQCINPTINHHHYHPREEQQDLVIKSYNADTKKTRATNTQPSNHNCASITYLTLNGSVPNDVQSPITLCPTSRSLPPAQLVITDKSIGAKCFCNQSLTNDYEAKNQPYPYLNPNNTVVDNNSHGTHDCCYYSTTASNQLFVNPISRIINKFHSNMSNIQPSTSLSSSSTCSLTNLSASLGQNHLAPNAKNKKINVEAEEDDEFIHYASDNAHAQTLVNGNSMCTLSSHEQITPVNASNLFRIQSKASKRRRRRERAKLRLYPIEHRHSHQQESK